MHLAELNIGRLLAPTDDARVADFMNNLDRINRLGKRMPGFVWMSERVGRTGDGEHRKQYRGRSAAGFQSDRLGRSAQPSGFRLQNSACKIHGPQS